MSIGLLCNSFARKSYSSLESPSYNYLYKRLEEMPLENILEVRHLQKAFGRHEVLKDINFTVEQGKIVGLLGKTVLEKQH